MMELQQDYSPAANDVASDGTAEASSHPLYDVVQIAVRAMDVPLAVIVLDTASPNSSRAVVAAAANDPWVRDHATVDFARLADPRTAEAYGLAFYTAVPLRNVDAVKFGTLVVLDRDPRPISEDDLATLKRLARVAGALSRLSPVAF